MYNMMLLLMGVVLRVVLVVVKMISTIHPRTIRTNTHKILSLSLIHPPLFPNPSRDILPRGDVNVHQDLQIVDSLESINRCLREVCSCGYKSRRIDE